MKSPEFIDSNKNNTDNNNLQSKPSRKRPRPLLSCGECRRLKLKCDRVWPCSSCKKRGCAAICPDGTLKGGTMSRSALVSNTSALLSRIDQLENTIKNQGGIVPPPSQPLISSAASAFNSPPPLPQNHNTDEDFAESFGALTLGKAGQARYIGPSAGSEWLQNDGLLTDEEDDEDSPSPDEHPDSPFNEFPFDGPTNHAIIQQIWSQLPPIDTAKYLGDIYFRYNACLYYCVPRDAFDEDVENLYPPPSQNENRQPEAHKLARLFMILSLGIYFDITKPQNHPDCTKYYTFSKSLLSASEFMIKCSIATAQTLHLMGSYLLNKNRISGGDAYWPLLGIKMRIIQAMGLHRDGERWGFSQKLLNERRRTFWESHTIDVFQSICFGRPYSTHARHIDCEVPVDEEARNFDSTGKDEGYGFHSMKFKLVKHLCRISDDIYGVNPPPYETVIHIDRGIREFEKNIPMHLRCRAVSLVRSSSNYPHEYLEYERGNTDEKLILQQHTLALNVNECLLYVNRRYFAHALKTHPEDPLKSPFAQSFIAVMECSRVILALVKSIHSLLPELSTRHWYFFYHLFSGGICSAALCIISPGSSMASDAWKDLNSIIELCELPSAGKRANGFVPALKRLRERALSRVNAHIEAQTGMFDNDDDRGSDDEHMVMLGLGSRVVSKGQETRIKTPARSRSYSLQIKKQTESQYNNDSNINEYIPQEYHREEKRIKQDNQSTQQNSFNLSPEFNSEFTFNTNNHLPIDPVYEALLKQSKGSTSATEMFNSLWEYPKSNQVNHCNPPQPLPELNSNADNFNNILNQPIPTTNSTSINPLLGDIESINSLWTHHSPTNQFNNPNFSNNVNDDNAKNNNDENSKSNKGNDNDHMEWSNLLNSIGF